VDERPGRHDRAGLGEFTDERAASYYAQGVAPSELRDPERRAKYETWLAARGLVVK
jgi:hypothetical protein